MNKLILCIGLFVAVLAPDANAGFMRFEFSGTILAPFPDDGGSASGEFSGSFLLDTSVPDVRPQADNAHYDHAVIDASFDLNGTNYDFAPGPLDDVFVVNDSATFNDLFAIVGGFRDLSGNSVFASFQFGDSSQTAFTSDEFPSLFDYTAFDDFVVDDANGSGAFFIFGGADLQGSINSAQFYAIPEPGSWSLLVVGFAAFVAASRRRKITP